MNKLVSFFTLVIFIPCVWNLSDNEIISKSPSDIEQTGVNISMVLYSCALRNSYRTLFCSAMYIMSWKHEELLQVYKNDSAVIRNPLLWKPLVLHTYSYRNHAYFYKGVVYTLIKWQEDTTVEYHCDYSSNETDSLTCHIAEPLTYENGNKYPIHCDVRDRTYQTNLHSICSPNEKVVFHSNWYRLDSVIQWNLPNTWSRALHCFQIGLTFITVVSIFVLPYHYVKARLTIALLLLWVHCYGIHLVTFRRFTLIPMYRYVAMLQQVTNCSIIQAVWCLWIAVVGYSRLWIWSYYFQKLCQQSSILLSLSNVSNWLLLSTGDVKSTSEKDAAYTAEGLLPLMDRLAGIIFAISYVIVHFI